MVEPIAAVSATTALVTLTFAGILVASGPKETTNVVLAFFLFLLAGNQAAVTLFHLPTGPEPSTAPLWGQFAAAFAALDPLFLYYFASVFPERNRLHRPRYLLPIAAVSLGLTLFFPQMVQSQSSTADGFQLFWSLFTATVYGIVLWHFTNLAASSDREPDRVIFPAIAVAAIPTLPRFLDHLSSRLQVSGTLVTGIHTALVVAVAAGAGWLILRTVQHASPERLGTVRLGVGLGVVLALVAEIPLRALLRVWGLEPGPFSPLPRLVHVWGGIARWLLFCWFASKALVSHDLLSTSLKSRQRTARVLVSVGFFVAAVIGLVSLDTVFETGLTDLDPLTVGAIAIGMGATQGFRDLRNRVARRLYGIPVDRSREEAIQLYRNAVEGSVEAGEPIVGNQRLENLRTQLGLDPTTVEVLHRQARDSPVRELAEGALVADRYRVRRSLGEGGSGRAYLARDELLDRDVVLKSVERRLEGAGAVEEARKGARPSHPHLVTVFDVVRAGDENVIVMEYLPGGSLADRLRRGPMEPYRAVEIVAGVLDGLSALHEQDIVHRDVKPGNVILDEDGTPKLADFGITGSDDRERSQHENPAGTPSYMGPELLDGGPAGPTSDVYAAGRMLEACLVGPSDDGQNPLLADQTAHRTWPEDPNPSNLCQDLPDRLEDVIERATREDPEDRWASAARMRDALQDLDRRNGSSG